MDVTFKQLILAYVKNNDLDKLIKTIESQLDHEYNQGYNQGIIDTLTKQLNKTK